MSVDRQRDVSGANVEVGIVTGDAEKLAAFYSAGLGFAVVAHYRFPRGEVYRLLRGDARCKLFQPVEPPRTRILLDPWYADPGIRYGALIVRDADHEVERVRDAGGTVLEGVVAHRPGARYALICDPEGNVWEILEE